MNLDGFSLPLSGVGARFLECEMPLSLSIGVMTNKDLTCFGQTTQSGCHIDAVPC